VTVVYDANDLPTEWPDLAAVVQVNREREVGSERAATSHYYIASYPGAAAEFAGCVRAIRASRTGCTGSSTWRSGRTAAAFGRGTPGPTRR
jgi:hypothetical protein